MTYADIIIDISSENLDRTFQYRVPEALEGKIQPGVVVSIPFGKGNQLRKGYVVGLSENPEFDVSRMKEVAEIRTGEETTESRLIALAAWMRENYGSTMIQALRTVLPVQAKVKAKEKRRIYLNVSREEGLRLLEELKGTRYKARARLLEALLNVEETEIPAAAGNCGGIAGGVDCECPNESAGFPQNSASLEESQNCGLADGKTVSGIDAAWAAKELGAAAPVLEYFQKNGVIRLEQREIFRMPLDGKNISRIQAASLTPSQQAAVEAIVQEWNSPSVPQQTAAVEKSGELASLQPRPALIYGVTGSGKTEVYMELISRTLAEGKQVIVLIPEIALTYQTVRRFYGRFGEQVSVLNSRLSQGERYDQFRRAKNGDISIMVGPRSALFTPFSRLGLIIMDEEHEPTYKSENSPRYHARETAVQRARMEGARVVFGSATPSLEAYSRALSGEYLLVKLAGRFEERPLPQVVVADLREELKAGNRSAMSRELKNDLENCLRGGHQAMLFLNRRGYAGFVSCRSCGQVMKCPHCDVALSEHNGGRLICHYCGYETRKPSKCPVCGSPYIGGFKAGTQQIEQLVKKEFPEAKVLRMDFDTTRTKGSYEEILAAFAEHQADILIGTQMIVKGHDFPDVTLVGVIAADLSLNGSDYRCGERTFQLLTQAVGRSGRGRFPGKAVIQTYNPEHYCIQAAAQQDYEAFYQEEMSYRQLLDYPPAAHMLAVLGSCEQEEQLTAAMHYVDLFVRKICPGRGLTAIGPAPAAVGKVKDVYRQVLYLKHRDYRLLVSVKDRLEKYIEANSGFRKIYIQFDFS